MVANLPPLGLLGPVTLRDKENVRMTRSYNTTQTIVHLLLGLFGLFGLFGLLGLLGLFGDLGPFIPEPAVFSPAAQEQKGTVRKVTC